MSTSIPLQHQLQYHFKETSTSLEVKNGGVFPRRSYPNLYWLFSHLWLTYKHVFDKINLSNISSSEAIRYWTPLISSQRRYLDDETPDALSYDNKRRIRRGMFKSNKGILINADVNAAYQIMKAGGIQNLPVKEREKVVRLNVA